MRSFERELVPSRASQLPSILLAVVAWIRAQVARIKRRALAVVDWSASVATDRVLPFLAGPVKTFVLGRRTGVSVGLALASVVIATGVAWWVGTTTGYPPIHTWAEQTVAGTHPHGIVFLGVAALVALGALVAAANAGLVPTTLVVVAPVFGLAVTRYGTRYTDPFYGTQFVSLPQAIEFAAAAALLVGVPVALVGFLLGVLLRFGLRSVDVPTEAVVDRLDR